jgi:hypothetical protein
MPKKSKASDKHLPPAMRKSTEAVTTPNSTHELDTPDASFRLKKLQMWRRQARVAQSENRTQMAIDEDYYDGIQLEAEDLAILSDRNQPPLVYNVIKNAINWVLGTEKKSRFDWRVLPRQKKGAAAAKTKTSVLKYVNDVSMAEYMRSEAFTEAVCAGLGWLEFGARNTDEVLFVSSERWRNMWFDHLGLRADTMDWRFVLREKWTDLDVALAMFPDRTEELKVLAEGVNSLYPYHPDDTVITDNATEFDLESDLDSLFGGPFDSMRQRVKLIEMDYRMPERVDILKMRDLDTPYGALHGAIFRSDEPEHQYLVKGGYFTTENAVKMVVRHAMWAGNIFLQDALTRYNHNRFRFVPIFCYRRKRDNQPYGIIRDIRDPQSDLNMRKSKSLFLMTANQIVIEKNATDDVMDFHNEMQRADGIAVVGEGKIEKWKQVKHEAMISEHSSMAQDDERFIHSISGVTNDSEWQSRRELSGKAISLMQSQGATAHGVVFDNYYRAIQFGGEIMLSNVEQFYDKEKEIRITGNQSLDKFITINDGSAETSITALKADFIVSKQDYRDTIRQNMLDQFFELVTNLAKVTPEVAVVLLDLAISMMDDLPYKDEAVARIRKISRQHAPDEELSDEEKVQIQQEEAKMAQETEMMKKIQQALMQVQVSEAESRTLKNAVDAAVKRIEGFIKAIEAAGNIVMAPQVVKAADALIQESHLVEKEEQNNQRTNA